MTEATPFFRPADARLIAAGMELAELQPLIDGVPLSGTAPQIASSARDWTLTWPASGAAPGSIVLTITTLRDTNGAANGLRLELSCELDGEGSLESLGLRIGRVEHALRYLRSGYTSWDGSFFVELDSARAIVTPQMSALTGHAVTALVDERGQAAVLGFLRHDRYQSRLRFDFGSGPLRVDVETLTDGVRCNGRVTAEPLLLLAGPVEDTLRAWARHVAAASPRQPRLRARRISGWCSWYGLYAAIDEKNVLEHLRAAAAFRERSACDLEVFQIDDGFTPEMGDWLDVKPQFPRGMAPVLMEIREAGFIPGLWIAPLMVGNRSRLFALHPDWVVRDRDSGAPLAPMKFYGEFRWHKRSEEYYVLDITHPEADAYIRQVLRTWRNEWGCGYFKTDFMHFGCDYAPKQARRYVDGASRMQIWLRMVQLIREEIGDALWLASGTPIWAPIGYVDAVRIGRDIGVSWTGHYSAESLLRDQTARNFANGILWQADPDCILLRDRFHDLNDAQVRSLALFAGFAGGVLMTSDHLGEVPPGRAELFALLAQSTAARACDFPRLGLDALAHGAGVSHLGAPMLLASGDPVLLQRVWLTEETPMLNIFNTGERVAERFIEHRSWASGQSTTVRSLDPAVSCRVDERGVRVLLQPFESCRLVQVPRAVSLPSPDAPS